MNKDYLGRKNQALIIRFHDGKAKSNWGGRATSLAMSRVLFEMKKFENIASINGDIIVNGFSSNRYLRLIDKTIFRICKTLGIMYPKWDMINTLSNDFLRERNRDHEISNIITNIENSQSVWVNGEGDFILANRYSLFRTLLLMQVAIKLGKEVSLVNSILSMPRTNNPYFDHVKGAIEQILPFLKIIYYRDPESFDLHSRLFPKIQANWCPDALFKWVDEGSHLSRNNNWFGSNSEGLPLELQVLLADSKSKIVGISGSSQYSAQNNLRGQHLVDLTALIYELRKCSLVPVIIATDSVDYWMQEVAIKEKCFFVNPEIPLSSAMKLLSRLSCLISGRYHPSILAATVGTPCIFMESNSHKTRSLQTILGIQPSQEFPFFGEKPNLSEIIELMQKTIDQPRDIDKVIKIAEAVKYIY